MDPTNSRYILESMLGRKDYDANQTALSYISNIMMLLIALSSSVLNVIVVHLYMRMAGRRRNTQNVLLCCISSVDIFMTLNLWLYLLIFNIAATNDFKSEVNLLYLIYKLVQDYSCSLALSTLLISVLDVYLSLPNPLTHKAVVTKSSMCRTVVIVYCTCLLVPLVRMSATRLKNEHTLHYDVYKYCINIGFIAMIIFIITILGVMIRKTNEVRDTRPPESSQRSTAIQFAFENEKAVTGKKQKQIVKIYVIMISIFFFTYIPTLINMIINKIQSSLTEDVIYLACDLCFHLSTALNPVVILYVKRDYRSSLKRLLERKSYVFRFKMSTVHPRNDNEVASTSSRHNAESIPSDLDF